MDIALLAASVLLAVVKAIIEQGSPLYLLVVPK